MALRDLDGVHVLVVEDTDDSREVLRVVLQYCGALVTTAASKEEAKRILETIRPHVLVSDIGMPDDGLELIRDCRQSEAIGSQPLCIQNHPYLARLSADDRSFGNIIELLERVFQFACDAPQMV
jgi:CheY-like chemotaxis protein